MSSVAVGRLRSIAKTVRQLPTFYQVRGSIADHYFLIVDKGAAFIREAESLGAFQGDSIYGRVGEKLAHPSCHLDDMVPIAARKVPAWKLTVWYAVVDTLAPELTRKRSRSIVRDANGNYLMRLDTSEEEAEIVARAIEAEADRLEGKAVVVPQEPRRDNYATPENFERDKWLYEQKKAEKTVPSIEKELRRLIREGKRGWFPLGQSGIRTAVHNYCEQFGLDYPLGKPGKPSERP